MKSLLGKELSFCYQNKKKFDLTKIESLSLYLSAGYSLNDILTFVEGLDDVITMLKNGLEFKDWLRNNGFKLLSYLLDHLSLQEALNCYLKITNFKEKFNKELAKAISYPLLQLILAFALSILAQNWLLPLLEGLLLDLNLGGNTNHFFFYLIRMVNIAIITVVVVVIILCFVLHYFESSLLFILLKRKELRAFKELVVQRFLSYYLIFYQVYDSSELIINSLRKLPNEPLVKNFADLIHFRLLDGESLASAFALFDTRLAEVMKVGEKTNKTFDLLSIYLKNNQELLFKHIKSFGRLIQGFSYLYIGLIVLLVYQLMLMPLEMVERL